MTPSLEQPPERTRTSAAPGPAQPPVDRQYGTAQDLLGLLGAPGNDPARERAICVQFRRLPARAALFDEGTPAEAIHVVRSGSFKSCRTDADGGERVLGFARRGDVLGYGALGLGRHTAAAVALEPSSVAVVPLADLFAWLQRLPALSLQHARADELSDVHAVVPAEVRLARFLLHWSHRMATSGQSVRQFRLAMSRRDIARLLGVAHETVSRSFGSLAASGCVAVTGRTVDILDAAALQAAARSPIALQPLAKRDAESARLHRVPAPS
jgi:CRP/FNR family transcriptional regulator